MGGDKMPNISIEGPKIKDLDKKRVLIKEMTDAAVKAYALPKEAIVILIKENLPENVGIGGQLIADRH
jgi:4-oxalocrotonate tautomerase